MKKKIKRLAYSMSLERDKLHLKWLKSKYWDGYNDCLVKILDKLEIILKLPK